MNVLHEDNKRTELQEFHGQHRLFQANIQRTGWHRPKHRHHGFGFFNVRLCNVFDVKTGKSIAVRKHNTRTDHMWAPEENWAKHLQPETREMQKADLYTFIAKVDLYDCECKNYADYCFTNIDHAMFWRNDWSTRMNSAADIIAEYEYDDVYAEIAAGCSDSALASYDLPFYGTGGTAQPTDANDDLPY